MSVMLQYWSITFLSIILPVCVIAAITAYCSNCVIDSCSSKIRWKLVVFRPFDVKRVFGIWVGFCWMD